MTGARPRHNFWEAVALVFKAATKHWRTCLVIAASYAVLSGLVNAISRGSTGVLDPTTIGIGEVAAAGVQAVLAIAAFVLVNALVAPVTLGAMSLVGSGTAYDDRVETEGTVRRALDRALDAIGAWLLTLLILAVPMLGVAILAAVAAVFGGATAGFTLLAFGSIAVGIPLLVVLVRLSLAIPVVMREGLGPIAALKRSWALVRGGWWWVFGITVVIAVVAGVVVAVANLRSFASNDSSLDLVVGALVTAIASGVSVILYGIASGVMYARRAPEDTLPPEVVASEARLAADAEPPQQ